jgi:hypothetical protein
MLKISLKRLGFRRLQRVPKVHSLQVDVDLRDLKVDYWRVFRIEMMRWNDRELVIGACFGGLGFLKFLLNLIDHLSWIEELGRF